MKFKSAFTMVELVFVIVIIGVLASMAIPKLSALTDGAKKSAEIATISAVATAIETANGEWSINEGDFSWGNNQRNSINPLNSKGYPTTLSKDTNVFGAILKGENSKFNDHGGPRIANTGGVNYTITILTGPSSSPISGSSFQKEATNSDVTNKPDKNDFWIYTPEINGTLCTYGNKEFFSGDLMLIDVNDTGVTNYLNIGFTSCTP